MKSERDRNREKEMMRNRRKSMKNSERETEREICERKALTKRYRVRERERGRK